MARDNFSHIGAHLIEIHCCLSDTRFAECGVLLDQRQPMSLKHCVPKRNTQLAQQATNLGANLVLHLHRFHHQHDLP